MNFISIHGKIADFASKNPEKIAIDYGEEKITYSQLDDNSNMVAGFLMDHIDQNRNILIYMEKHPAIIISILGILKYGSVFIPLNTTYPQNRISTIIDEVQACWVITLPNMLEKLNDIMEEQNYKINVLVLDSNDICLNKYKNLNIYLLNDYISKSFIPTNEIQNKHCYIYYTSGSTGKPNGILGRHKSLMHFINWEISEFKLDENIRVSQFTSPAFDPFLRDIFVPLCAGGTVCIPEDDEIIKNAAKMEEWIDRKNISLIHIVPSLFKILTSYITSNNKFINLKYIFLAGELLRGNDVRYFYEIFQDRIQLINLYGPTETTLAKFFYRIKSDDSDKTIIPVGKAIDSTEVIILDNDLKPCRTGIEGEIYIRTPYITSGYYNNKELTRKVFIKNPFSINPQDIIYKSGDIGRILQNGNLEVLGRIDHQVKINGVRIELRDVEKQLLQYDTILDATIIAYDDEMGNKYLCAYFTSNSDISIPALRGHMLKNLPSSMVPTHFIQLEFLPLTHNGKLDRKALKKPKISNFRDSYEAPRNELERELAKIWSEILGVGKIGISDSFFELGGDSLKAIRVTSKLERIGVKIKNKDIFQCITIKNLSEMISITGNNESDNCNFEYVEKKLYDMFNVTCKFISYNLVERKYHVLYIENRKFEKYHEIIDYISENFAQGVQPNYIRKISEIKSDVIYGEILSDSDFSELMGLKCVNDQLEQVGILDNILQQNYEFSKCIMKSEITQKYPISSIQKLFLMFPKFNYAGMSIRFDRNVNIGVLNKAIHILIMKQTLLRSVIEKCDSGLYWKEFIFSETKDIPFLDLTDYSPKTSRTLMDSILPQYFCKEYEVSNNLLYRILLVKENEREYVLYLPFNHTIYDGMSSDIIKGDILKYYESLINNTEIEYEKMVTFKDYIYQINKGPQDISEEEIIQKYNLREYKNSVFELKEIFESEGKEYYRKCCFDIEIDDEFKDLVRENPMEITLSLFIRMCREFFGLQDIPIWLFSYGRKYQKSNYYHLVGELIDLIPMHIKTHGKSLNEIKEYISERIKIAVDYNINFSNLIMNDEIRARYKNISSIFSKNETFKDPMLIFNFQGIGDSDKMDIHDYLSGNLRTKENHENINNTFIGVLFNARCYQDKIRIIMNWPFDRNFDILQKFFIKETQKILKLINLLKI